MAGPTGERRKALVAAAESQAERWETAFSDQLESLWARQEGVVLARLQGKKSKKGTRHWSPPGELKVDPGYVLDPNRWMLEAVNAIRDLMLRMFRDVVNRVLKHFGVDPGDDDPAASDAVKDAVEQRLEVVAETVRGVAEQVQHVIEEADDAGQPMPVIAERVRATYADRREGWTRKIVASHVVGAMNEASLMAALGVGVTRKQWLSGHDSRVRPTHVKADGQTVDIGKPFKLGGFDGHPAAELDYPGDPEGPIQEWINCRCTLLFPMPAPGQIEYDPAMFKTGVSV